MSKIQVGPKKVDVMSLTNGDDITYLRMIALPGTVQIQAWRESDASYTPRTARAIARDLIKLADRAEKAGKKAK